MKDKSTEPPTTASTTAPNNTNPEVKS
jgi:hypothetical protein